MKRNIYLIVLILPLFISAGLSTQQTINQDSMATSSLDIKSFDLAKKWRINAPAFFDKKATSYTLNPTVMNVFGHFVEFKTDGTFDAYYHASCGNDCFTTSNGTYKIKGNTLEIYVISAKQEGFCADPLSFKNTKMGAFQITEEKTDHFLLKKI